MHGIQNSVLSGLGRCTGQNENVAIREGSVTASVHHKAGRSRARGSTNLWASLPHTGVMRLSSFYRCFPAYECIRNIHGSLWKKLSSTKISIILCANVLPFILITDNEKILLVNIDSDIWKPEPVDITELTFYRCIVCCLPLAPSCMFTWRDIYPQITVPCPNVSSACP